MNRKFRITSTNDFQRVRHSGKTYAHPLLVVIVARSQSENSHAGIITSKAIGNAVTRNRARRRIRSVMAGHLINFIQPHDIVIIARKPIVEATYQDIEQAIREELHKAGLLS